MLEALQQRDVPAQLIDPHGQPLDRVNWSEFALAFIALHGDYGEDGQVQRDLERWNVRYTGSDAIASALAFDKLAAKRRFEEHNLPTPPAFAVSIEETEARIRHFAQTIGFPLVVKPNASGSSLGVSIVESDSRLMDATELARTFGPVVLLEQFIPGEEWTVGLLDDIVLPPLRVGSSHPFFDYSAKYSDEQTEYEVVEAGRSATAQEVGKISQLACKAIGCRGISRVDLRVDPAGQPWLLEVNTVPGLTKRSLVPRAAAGLGWSMSDLCERIITSALQK